jgi:signal transduction histidine kinase
MFTHWSIPRRLTLLVTLTAAVIIGFILLLTITSASAAVNEQVEATLIRQTDGEAQNLDRTLQAAAATTRALAATLNGRPDSPVVLWEASTALMQDTDHLIYRIGVVRPYQGQYQTVIFRAPGAGRSAAPLSDFLSPEPPDWSGLTPAPNSNDVQWFGPTEPVLSNSTTPVIMAATTFRAPEGDGVLWVELSARDLPGVLEEVTVFEGTSTDSHRLLVDSDGQIIAAFEPDPMARRSLDLDALSADPALAPLLNVPQTAGEGEAIRIVDDPFGRDRTSYVTTAQVPATGWNWVSVVPTTEALGSAGQLVLGIVVLSIAAVLLLAVLTFRFGRRNISEPLEAMTGAAREIGSGDMRYQVGYTGEGGEIGELALALDDMKANLANSYDQLTSYGRTLEKRVAQRTSELEESRRTAETTANELQSVYSSSVTLVGEYTSNAVVQRLIEQAPALLSADYCSVWLLDANADKLVLAGSTADQIHLGRTIEGGGGLAGAVNRSGAPLRLDSYSEWPQRLGWLDPAMERALAVPLLVQGKPTGALIVGRPAGQPTFDDNDQRLLELLANIASPVVYNAGLYVQLDEAKQAAESANQVKTRFLASVTHELRTPLNLVINNMDFMRVGMFGNITEEQRDRLNQTIRSAEHLLYLINDLLDVSKIEAGEMHLSIHPADVYPIIEDALDSAAPLLEGKPEITLHTDVAEDLPLIPLDARRARQIFTNLLTNAIKYTERGEVHFSARLDPSGRELEIAVRDTGIGIPPDEQERIFEAFERSQSVRQLAIEGTGLGLAITRFLVQAHGGHIGLQSEPGVGSTFTVLLPLTTPDTTIQPEIALTAELNG